GQLRTAVVPWASFGPSPVNLAFDVTLLRALLWRIAASIALRSPQFARAHAANAPRRCISAVYGIDALGADLCSRAIPPRSHCKSRVEGPWVVRPNGWVSYTYFK